MSYPGLSLGVGDLTSRQKSSRCILQPQPTGQSRLGRATNRRGTLWIQTRCTQLKKKKNWPIVASCSWWKGWLVEFRRVQLVFDLSLLHFFSFLFFSYHDQFISNTVFTNLWKIDFLFLQSSEHRSVKIRETERGRNREREREGTERARKIKFIWKWFSKSFRTY